MWLTAFCPRLLILPHFLPSLTSPSIYLSLFPRSFHSLKFSSTTSRFSVHSFSFHIIAFHFTLSHAPKSSLSRQLSRKYDGRTWMVCCKSVGSPPNKRPVLLKFWNLKNLKIIIHLKKIREKNEIMTRLIMCDP